MTSIATPGADAAPHRSSTPIAQGRLRELDGLRGLAAVVVLIHHCLLTVPSLAEVGARPGTAPSGSLERLLALTPLHLLWGGYEAVLIFFILSGVALSYPIARRRATGHSFDWVDYAPRRLIRLWVPAGASTLLAIALIILVPRSNDASLGAWVQAHYVSDISLKHTVRELALQPAYAYRNSVLWSLHAEAAFSILLPLVILVVALAARARLSWALLAAALAVPLVSGNPGSGLFLPVFAIGAALGWRWGAMTDPLPARPARWASAAAVASLIMMTAPWWVAPGAWPELLSGGSPEAPASWGSPASPWGHRVGAAIAVAGATGTVVLIVRAGALRPLLRSKVVQVSGELSFSLYLVHTPVVLLVRTLVPSMSPWWMLLVGPVVALPAAWLFHRLIERPSHRWSRVVGRWASRGLRARHNGSLRLFRGTRAA
ncbi:Peptidoglycan/LPS O-acetylase OafA/YrhL, contains acyltransferase and SGNH-hydrolase domains [Actinomyces denticolens]|uniref:Peptidoglycan/LPS O-acetylase OafA/YrhL, contains acyltransferase and SGNH-hydrolase domains n=1 Tax=Actinomyces denticolens TaxID=52767 RepID=A0ABY1IH41_9ACTO|nr:acyltransferase [Actinomyces denticolens]SHJ16745.1 Peptidoglycan/LPS O-acetylase OafA/YrhL, contains acyltransferase and SGNH-hydrolase domains [Actinomyces denticolens]